MKPSFHPRLVNDTFSDPGLFVPFLFQRRALLFDLGDLSRLSARDLLKVSHIFVTHTHMDHFIGFDQVLRLLIGRDTEVHLFGPSGFIEKVEAKLSAYTWNLIEGYENTLFINVTEIRGQEAFVQRYSSRKRFLPTGPAGQFPFKGNLLAEKSFSIDAVILDHKIDCLGFSLRENFSINIIKEGLKELGLSVGPWLREFKDALYEGRDGSERLRVECQDGDRGGGEKEFTIAELRGKIARFSPGQKVTYLADMIGSPGNMEKAIELARGSHYLFIEAPFLHKDRDIARRKYHLTAKEAGLIAAKAGVKELIVFHFSPRYFGREQELINEAMAVFQSDPTTPSAV